MKLKQLFESVKPVNVQQQIARDFVNTYANKKVGPLEFKSPITQNMEDWVVDSYSYAQHRSLVAVPFTYAGEFDKFYEIHSDGGRHEPHSSTEYEDKEWVEVDGVCILWVGLDKDFNQSKDYVYLCIEINDHEEVVPDMELLQDNVRSAGARIAKAVHEYIQENMETGSEYDLKDKYFDGP